ncbi:MAG TPA: thioredoxin family protein [Bacteroidia bacterium]|jgi:protein disulfide-isomerase|nr:thioredoxin family protein [Bacteroidia bacterium]
MKKGILLLLFFISTSVLSAQELTWYTDVNEAMKISEQTKKPLMFFFTGSDWCGWCIRLQNEVFRKPEFTKWAAEKVILVEVDFPRRKQLPQPLQTQNSELQNFFGVSGFPTVWFVTAAKKDDKIMFTQLGKTGYVAGGPEVWLTGANQILANK